MSFNARRAKHLMRFELKRRGQTLHTNPLFMSLTLSPSDLQIVMSVCMRLSFLWDSAVDSQVWLWIKEVRHDLDNPFLWDLARMAARDSSRPLGHSVVQSNQLSFPALNWAENVSLCLRLEGLLEEFISLVFIAQSVTASHLSVRTHRLQLLQSWA